MEMHIFKKNWLYDINTILIILIAASLSFGKEVYVNAYI